MESEVQVEDLYPLALSSDTAGSCSDEILKAQQLRACTEQVKRMRATLAGTDSREVIADYRNHVLARHDYLELDSPEYMCIHCEKVFKAATSRPRWLCHFGVPAEHTTWESCKDIPNDWRFKLLAELIKYPKYSILGELYRAELTAANPTIRYPPIAFPTTEAIRRARLEEFHNEKASKNSRALMLFLLTANIPFHALENPYLKLLLNQLFPDAPPPDRRKAASSLLVQLYMEVKQGVLESMRAEVLNNEVFTIVGNGLTDLTSKDALTYLVISSSGRAFFLDLKYFRGESHTGRNVSESFVDVINTYFNERTGLSPESIVAICTDNASNMEVAKELVCQQFQHMIPLGCASYQFDLLLHRILLFPKIEKIFNDARNLAKFIKNSRTMLEAIAFVSGRRRVPALYSATRWTSAQRMLASLLGIRSGLKILGQLGSVKVNGGKQCENPLNKQPRLKEQVLSESFWMGIASLEQIIGPFVTATVSFERDRSKISFVVDVFEKLYSTAVTGPLAELVPNGIDSITDIFLDTAGRVFSPQIVLASLLDVEKVKNRNASRKTARFTLFGPCITRWFRTTYGEVTGGLLQQQLAWYCFHEGAFKNTNGLWTDNLDIPPENFLFWHKMKRTAAELASLANKLLRMKETSAAAERAWSTYKQVKASKRCSLSDETVRMGLFVNINERHVRAKYLGAQGCGPADVDRAEEDAFYRASRSDDMLLRAVEETAGAEWQFRKCHKGKRRRVVPGAQDPDAMTGMLPGQLFKEHHAGTMLAQDSFASVLETSDDDNEDDVDLALFLPNIDLEAEGNEIVLPDAGELQPLLECIFGHYQS